MSNKDINLYDVLGLERNCTRQQIKTIYRKLVGKHHPDKGGDSDIFELITNAFNILYDPVTRAEYDELFRISKQASSDHVSLKQAAEDFFKTQDLTEEQLAEARKKASKKFEQDFEDMDRKHKIDRGDNDINLDAITADEALKRMKDLETIREQDDIEYTHEKLFDDGQFNIKQFNAMFDKTNKTHDELVPHTGNPGAWNDADGMNFSSYATPYDTLYDDDANIIGDNYTGVNLVSSKGKKVNKKDLKHVEPANYVDGHNKNRDKTYMKTLEEKMRERTMEDKKLNDRSLNDFNTDESMDGYGIFQQLGITGSQIEWNNSVDDMQSKYNKLLQLRNGEIKKPKK
jgi:curved DNA-binding protein CbpA